MGIINDFLLNTTKLHGDLKSTVLSLSAWLNSLENLSSHIEKSKGKSSEVGENLKLLTKEHEMLLTNLVSLVEGFESEILGPVRHKTEQIKPRILEIDKNH